MGCPDLSQGERGQSDWSSVAQPHEPGILGNVHPMVALPLGHSGMTTESDCQDHQDSIVLQNFGGSENSQRLLTGW